MCLSGDAHGSEKQCFWFWKEENPLDHALSEHISTSSCMKSMKKTILLRWLKPAETIKRISKDAVMDSCPFHHHWVHVNPFHVGGD